jgi:hypothetical protein
MPKMTQLDKRKKKLNISHQIFINEDLLEENKFYTI